MTTGTNGGGSAVPVGDGGGSADLEVHMPVEMPAEELTAGMHANSAKNYVKGSHWIGRRHNVSTKPPILGYNVLRRELVAQTERTTKRPTP